ncbi:MAG: FapA family protein, partial [Bacillota bacterium]|nr:FapA family protein [Bacillota bacterium]
DLATVDHRERSRLVSVSPGDVLAVKTPAKLGEQGIDVTGKIWEPPFPKIINLQVGPGVELIEDGLKAVATADGQPMMKGSMLVVAPVYQVKAVNLETGNIRFKGTVMVQANVDENMVIEAKDNVEVAGSVNAAFVIAGNHISVRKSVVAGKLQAGGEAATYQTILTYLRQIPQLLTAMEAKSNMAREAMQKKGIQEKVSDGYLIKLMLENMYPQIGKAINELVAYVDYDQKKLDDQVQELIVFLQKAFTGLGPTQLDFSQLGKIKQVIFQVIGKLQQLTEVKANIEVGYAQNARLEASGDVVITGKGCYNADIKAGGTVRATGKPGVFRGGTIIAGGNVEIGELGTPTGAATQVTVPKAAKITARMVYPNVIIKIGNFSERIQNHYSHYEAWVSERGLETSKKNA